MGAAMLQDLRRRMVAGDEDVRKRFVVAQRDAVARRQPFDEVALEQQRLDLGLSRDDLERRRLRHHALQPVGEAVYLDVGGDALLQALGLADIERVALAVEHAVNARPARQRRQLCCDDCRSIGQCTAGNGDRRLGFGGGVGTIAHELCCAIAGAGAAAAFVNEYWRFSAASGRRTGIHQVCG